MFINNGNGVFSISNTIPNSSTSYSYDFGDVYSDGDLDMLGVDSQAGSFGEALFLNDGTGVFTDVSNQIIPNPSGDLDSDSKIFDIDNDGDLELIIATYSLLPEKIYINNGFGVFTLSSGMITSITDTSLDIMVADLTGDGRLDVVTGQGEFGSFTNRVYVNVLSGAIDTRAPRIIKTEKTGNRTGVNPLVVRAAILDDVSSDRGFFAKEILLHYTVNNGAEQTSIMRYSGGQIYRGEIPNNIADSVIHYHVEATDYANNTATGPIQMINNKDLIYINGFE